MCVASGTKIKTNNGQLLIESVSRGDLVGTRDNGFKEVKWIGCHQLMNGDLFLHPNLRPIRIKANALADGVPSQDLLVSPQHRVLVNSKIALRIFEVQEVFVPARLLLPLTGVEIAHDQENVSYFHLLCDQHELIEVNGAYTETLHMGSEAFKALSVNEIAQIELIFEQRPYFDANLARLSPSGKQAKELISRHVKNKKDLVC